MALSHATQYEYCIAGHTKLARWKGASDHEITEAIWVAAEMCAGALRAFDDRIVQSWLKSL